MTLASLTLLTSLAVAQDVPVVDEPAAAPATADSETLIDPTDTKSPKFYVAFNTGLTSIPYDSEFGLLGGFRLSRVTSLEVMIRTEALSLLWDGSWYNAGIGVRVTPGPADKQLRPTFGLSYAGGALSNNFTTEGGTITEMQGGEQVSYPSKVTWKRNVGFGRLDLDGGIRWQRTDTRAFVCALVGLYNIPKSRATDTWVARSKLGVDAELLDTTLRDLEGAGFSHWLEKGYTTAYLRIMLGMDF